jgi:hypothetical protein
MVELFSRFLDNLRDSKKQLHDIAIIWFVECHLNEHSKGYGIHFRIEHQCCGDVQQSEPFENLITAFEE